MVAKKHHIEASEFYQKLGERLKTLRIAADYGSAEAFSREFAIGRTQYLEYEKGRNMELSTLIKLARIHELTVEELLSGIE